MSAKRTHKAIRECAMWLSQCLGFGWKKEQLDLLEALWWKHHDYSGNLMRGRAETQGKRERYR